LADGDGAGLVRLAGADLTRAAPRHRHRATTPALKARP